MKRKIISEIIGTFFLLAIVVGSGIMGERLSNGTPGLALLANSIATGAGLIVLILMFGQSSGAHFNPLVSIAETIHGRLKKNELAFYILAQAMGAFLGVIAAHLMFGETYLAASTHVREGFPTLLSEFIATFGLISVIRTVGRNKPESIPVAVGLYIAAAYWFTASTSFANPIVTAARAFTNTFSGIRPQDVMGFWLAQICGALSAELLFKWFDRSDS